VPSPPGGHYESTPEMSADKITENVLENLTKYPFVAVNFANADMVGHSGNIDATKIACHTVDQQVEAVVAEATKRGYAVMVTADHGNAEQMIDPMTNEPDTSHTNNPVPFIFVDQHYYRPKTGSELPQAEREIKASLADVAPTILEILGVGRPKEMRSINLLDLV